MHVNSFYFYLISTDINNNLQLLMLLDVKYIIICYVNPMYTNYGFK